MLKLVAATSVSTIRASCACPDQGTYHLKLHVRLRQMYTAVWWCENGQAVDEQRLYQRCGGHSAHAMFVVALHQKGGLGEIPNGPQSTAGRGRKRARESPGMKRMLAAPAGDAAYNVPAQAASAPARGSADDVPSEEGVRTTATDAGRCFASTQHGARCNWPRVADLFCRVHTRMSTSAKFVGAMQRKFAASLWHRLAGEEREARASSARSIARSQRMQKRRSGCYARKQSSTPGCTPGDCGIR